MAVTGDRIAFLVRLAAIRRDLSLARLSETAGHRAELITARDAAREVQRTALADSLTTPGYLPLVASFDRWAERRSQSLTGEIAAVRIRERQEIAVAAQDLGRAEALSNMAESLRAEGLKIRRRRAGEA